MRAGIIADDLTGACDSAARAACAGWRTRVVLNGSIAGSEITVVSTATRGLPAEQAAGLVAEAARSLIARGIRPLFKKIDSTLRGPWAEEVAALCRVTAPQIVAVCPAFPACERTVREGVAYCREEAIGVLAPALQAAGLGKQAPGAPALIIGDAESDADLAAFVQTVAARGGSVLWVGSAGLARFAFGQREQFAPPFPAVSRWLIVAGSNHPATLAQLDAARAAGLEVSGKLPAAAPGPGFGLFFIGGDTAERAVRLLKTAALDVYGEALPGVAAGRLISGVADGAAFLSKSGGFGGAQAILEAIAAIGQ